MPRTGTPEVWSGHSIEELATQTKYWLRYQRRITHPVVICPGDMHYSKITWDDTFALVGEKIWAGLLGRRVLYNLGRTANKSAFMHQLFTRSIGTNNLPV